jgi:hypothetical protein
VGQPFIHDGLHRADFIADGENHYQLLLIPASNGADLQSNLKLHGNIVVAWLHALLKAFPGWSPMELMRRKPALFPSFLRLKERADSIQVCIALAIVEERCKVEV